MEKYLRYKPSKGKKCNVSILIWLERVFKKIPSIEFQCHIIRINYQGRKDCEQNTAICGLKVDYEEVKREAVDIEGIGKDPLQRRIIAAFEKYLGKMKTVRKRIGVNGLTFKCCPILKPGRYFETPETSLSYSI